MLKTVSVSYALIEQGMQTGNAVGPLKIHQGIGPADRLVGCRAEGLALVLVFDDGLPSAECAEVPITVEVEQVEAPNG